MRTLLAAAEEVGIGPHWQEFEAQAARTKDGAVTALRTALAAREADEDAALAHQQELEQHELENHHEYRNYGAWAPPPPSPLLYRVQEAMRILSVSRSTIYRMIDKGDLISVKLGTATRITANSLEKVATKS